MTEALIEPQENLVPDYDVLNPPSEAVADFPGKMRWFARLSMARRHADEHLDQIKSRIAELEPHLIEEMAMNGVEQTRIDGLTIYQTTDLIVSKKAEKEGVTTEVLVEALRNCGLAYMIAEGYSASSLKAKVKEWKEEGIELPAALADKINVIEKVKLVTRK